MAAEDAARPRADAARGPYDGASQPHDGASQPYDGASQPHDGASQPHGGASQPRDGASEPRHGVVPQQDGASRRHHDRAAGPQQDGASPPGSFSGLLVDWGGVLTTSLFVSFHAYCLRMQIDPGSLIGRFSADPSLRGDLIALEEGALEEEAFELRFAAILGVEPEGLIDGLFEGVEPDGTMIEAVRTARHAGVRTALVSNSWGTHRYPHDLFEELFDGVVISGEEGIRKPSRRMYLLGAERAGVPAKRCVYVDDLPFNLAPAEKLGMATVHHTSAKTTIPQLESFFGLSLAAPSP